MNVLHFIDGLGTGGVESVLIEIIKGTHEKIHHKIIVKKNINIYESLLKKYNVEVIYSPSISLGGIGKHIKFIHSFLKENASEIDYIHIHSGSLNYFLPIFFGKKFKIKTIIHSHSSKASNKNLILVHRFLRLVLRLRYDTINLAVSEQAGIWMFGDENFEVILNGINIEKFEKGFIKGINNKKKLFGSNQIIIGHIGNFLPVKNQEFIVKFLSFLHKKDEKYSIVFVGDGPNRENVEKLVHDMHLDKFVTFYGFKSDIENYYGLFDVVIFPSYFEGLPLSLIEAQVNGIPILASNRIDEQIKINDNFYFIDILDDFENIYPILLKALTSGVGKSRVRQSTFTSEHMIKEILDVYYKNKLK